MQQLAFIPCFPVCPPPSLPAPPPPPSMLLSSLPTSRWTKWSACDVTCGGGQGRPWDDATSKHSDSDGSGEADGGGEIPVMRGEWGHERFVVDVDELFSTTADATSTAGVSPGVSPGVSSGVSSGGGGAPAQARGWVRRSRSVVRLPNAFGRQCIPSVNGDRSDWTGLFGDFAAIPGGGAGAVFALSSSPLPSSSSSSFAVWAARQREKRGLGKAGE